MRRNNKLKLIRTVPKRASALVGALILLFGVVLPVITPQPAAAAQLQHRSLSISSSAPGNISTDIAGNAVAAGAGGNGQKTAETYQFNIATTGNVGSMVIEFCDDPIPQDTCLTGGTIASSGIPGFDASHVAAIQSDNCYNGSPGTAGGTNCTGTGFTNAYSVDTTTNLTGAPWNCVNGAVLTTGRGNCIAIKAATANAVNSGDTTVFKFGGTTSDYITNPTNVNCTTFTNHCAFFARVIVYSDTAYTTQLDYGTVVGSTAQQINITAKVKEVLNFSVGDVTALTAPGTTCSPLGTGSSGALALGDTNGVLDFNQSYFAHSYFRVSTNTQFGTTIYYSGDTLKNGSNSIAAINSAANPGTSPGTAASSEAGMPQFGLAIDSSDTQGGNGYSFTNLTAGAQYANGGTGTDVNNGTGTNKYAYDTTSTTTPVILASSTGPVSCDTGSVKYVGNISTATPAGIYTTTITYIATGVY